MKGFPTMLLKSLAPAPVPALVRWFLLLGSLLVIARTCVDLISYPALLNAGGEVLIYLIMFAVAIAIYSWLALFRTRGVSAGERIALQQGTRWGFLCGAVWIAEVLVANVFGAQLGLLNVPLYFSLTLAGYFLPGLAALLAAHKSGQFAAGLQAGLLCGMLGGLLLFLSASALPFLLSGTQPDAGIMQEFQHSGLPDLQTFLAADLLAAMIAHLWIGLLCGLGLGLIGGSIGQALSRQAPELR